MLNFKINQENEYKIEGLGSSLKINGVEEVFDWVKLPDGRFHVIKNHQVYLVEVLNVDFQNKELELIINGATHHVQAKDDFDLLLEKMGGGSNQAQKHEVLKAPMPGKVLEIKVEAGQSVKEGEPLIILEAMKMENVLKASHDLVVGQVKVKQGDTVEKGVVLITF